MSHRTFRDATGEEWGVWDVFPSSDVRHTLEAGWLTFQSAREKRRLAPIPLYWMSADEAELERLLAAAKPVAERARPALGEDGPSAAP